MIHRSLVVASLLLLASASAQALGDDNAAAVSAMATFAGSDNGVVVWQSRQTGPMRLFVRKLDGTGLRQLTPDVDLRDQLAPLISPDGQRVVYYQTFTLTGPTYYDDHTGDLMLINIDGTGARLLVANVRTYFECRVARWLDNDRIAYIATNRDTAVYSLASSSSSKLFSYPYIEFGALPNRQLTHAIDGKNRVFSINNPGPSGTLTEQQDYDGCEGNMTHDGAWAYRVRGTDHNFTRMKLGSWEEESFFANHGASLPTAQDYIYFPQVSSDQRVLALGASPNQHDHFTSDYDIFLVRLDPLTFLPQGDAVKYSFNVALDAYPDVWVGPAVPPDPTLDRIDLSPPSAILGAGDTLEVSAHLTDQFGQPFAAPLTWSASGGGTLAPTSSPAAADHAATFVSDGTEGSFSVTATADSSSASLPIIVSSSPLHLRVNCGSNDYDVDGWARDDAFVSQGSDWTNTNEVETSGVADAAPPLVYKSVRHQIPHTYAFPLADGDYHVRLHFADAYTDRSMDYTIEGQVVLNDFDIATAAGGVNRALVLGFDVTVADGDGLQIEADGSGDDAFEAGIEIIGKEEPETPEPNPQHRELVGRCSGVGGQGGLAALLLLLFSRCRRRRPS